MKKLLNINNIFVGLVILFLISIPFYELVFKKYLIDLFKNRNDIIDKIYYTDIFTNGTLSLLIISSILILVLILKKYFNQLLENYSVKSILIYCLAFQIIFQIILLIFIKTIPISDSIYYIDYGKRLYETGKYISSSGYYTAFWPVGLPALIALINYFKLNSILIVNIFYIIISSSLLIILYLVFSNFLTDKQLKIFLILFTVYPNFIFSSQSILTELPFTFLLWSSILFTFKFNKKSKNLYLFIIGIMSGLATMIRANGLLILVTITIFIFLYKDEKLKHVIILFSGFVLINTFWVIRNYKHFNSFVLTSTNGGYNFLMGNNPNSNGTVNFNFYYNFKNPNEVLEENKAYKKGLTFILDNPYKFLLLSVKKVFYTYWRGDCFITWSLKKTGNYINPILKSVIFFITNIFYYIIIILSVIALIIRKNILNQPLVNIIKAYYLLSIVIVILYFGTERFNFQLLPIHFFLTSKLLKE